MKRQKRLNNTILHTWMHDCFCFKLLFFPLYVTVIGMFRTEFRLCSQIELFRQWDESFCNCLIITITELFANANRENPHQHHVYTASNQVSQPVNQLCVPPSVIVYESEHMNDAVIFWLYNFSKYISAYDYDWSEWLRMACLLVNGKWCACITL